MNKKKRLFINFTKKTNSKILIVGMVIFLFTFFIIFNRELFNSIINGDIEYFKYLLTDNLIYAYLFMLIVMIVQCTFTVIPLILVITINCTIFGFWNGFIWSWLTSILASILVFICVRYVFQDGLTKKINPETIAKVEQAGFTYVFQARILPFVPTSIVNILAGISSIRFKHFLLGTILGNLFYFFVLSLIPAGFMSSSVNEYVMGSIIVLFLVLYFSLKKIYNRKHKSPLTKTMETNRTED